MAGGLLLILLVARSAPLGLPPLYDGVIPEDPYRYLAPAAGQPANPPSYSGTIAVTGATTPNIVASTGETPPQAQLIAAPGAFEVPAGTSSVAVTIKPISPPSPAPPTGIVGNVYEISVTAGGTPLSPVAAIPVTVLFRAPAGVDAATIEQLTGGAWQPLDTTPAGLANMFLVNATALGDFAVIATPSSSVLTSPLFFLAIGVVAVAIAVVSFLYFDTRRRRPVRAPEPPQPLDRRARRRANRRR